MPRAMMIMRNMTVMPLDAGRSGKGAVGEGDFMKKENVP
jgi:hypothetical protein